MNWYEHLRTCLRDIQPDSVYALDPTAQQFASSVLRNTPTYPHEDPPPATCALALGIDALDGLDAQQAQHLISQTRLYRAPRILLVARQNCALDNAAFRALGFVLSAHDLAENTRILDFDLDTYKTVPEWLNARYWAHPERWEP